MFLCVDDQTGSYVGCAFFVFCFVFVFVFFFLRFHDLIYSHIVSTLHNIDECVHLRSVFCQLLLNHFTFLPLEFVTWICISLIVISIIDYSKAAKTQLIIQIWVYINSLPPLSIILENRKFRISYKMCVFSK